MFKESFKFYKAKWPVPDFTDVYDFENVAAHKEVTELKVCIVNQNPYKVQQKHRFTS